MQAEHSTPRKAGPPDSLTHRDFALAGLVFAAVFGLLLSFAPYEAPISRDPATWSYMSVEIARGMIPYRDIFIHKTPGGALLGAVGASIASWTGLGDPLAGARTVFLLLGALGPALLFLVCRPRTGVAVALTAAAFMVGYDQWPVAAFEAVRPKVAVVTFGLAAILAAQHGRSVRAGAAACISVLCWQPGLSFVVGAFASLMRTEKTGSTRASSIARYIAGGLVPLLCLFAWLGVHGALGDFFDQAVVFNFTYVSDKAMGPGATTARLLDTFLFWNPLESVFIFPALIGIAWLRPRIPIGVIVAGLSYLALTYASLQAWPDTILFAPLVATVLAVGLSALAMYVLSAWPQAAVVVLLMLACFSAATLGSTRLYPKIDLAKQQEFYRSFLKGVPTQASVVSISLPEFLIHNQRRSAWKWPYMFNRVDVYAAEKYGGFDGLFADLENIDPEVIMLGRRWIGGGRNRFERWASKRYVRGEHKFPPYSWPIVEFRRKPEQVGNVKN